VKYLGGSFQVGGYSKAYADNYDRIFGKKKRAAKTKRAPAASVEADIAAELQSEMAHLEDKAAIEAERKR
jgi:hypothetical protein